MTAHTPEPWTVEDDGQMIVVETRDVEDYQQYVIATTYEGGDPDGHPHWSAERSAADMGRIAACVNALAGLEPSGLGELYEAVSRWFQTDTAGEEDRARDDMEAALAKLDANGSEAPSA